MSCVGERGDLRGTAQGVLEATRTGGRTTAQWQEVATALDESRLEAEGSLEARNIRIDNGDGPMGLDGRDVLRP